MDKNSTSQLKVITISVVIPTYQSESFVRKTLETVAQQTILPDEIVIVDDGSTDKTIATIELFKNGHPNLNVKLLCTPHRGPGATRNQGILTVQSEWIAFLDSDDLWDNHKIEKVKEAITSNPQANFFCHNEIIIDLNGNKRTSDYGKGVSLDYSIPKQLYKNNFFSTSAVVCKRDLIIGCGGFDEELTSAQDYELWLRLSPKLVPIFIPHVLGSYVLRRGNITTSHYWKRLYNILRVKQKHRKKGGMRLYTYSVLRVTLSHLLAPLKNNLRKIKR